MTEPTAEQKAAATKAKLKKQGAAGSIVLAMILGTIGLEGGYVNDKNDPGGETNKGVTKTVARAYNYTGPMKALPVDVAVSVYYDEYVVKAGLEPLVQINAPVVEELFDTGVNMGPARPARWFEQSLNEICGSRVPVTAKVNSVDVQAFAQCQNRIGPKNACLLFLDSLDAKQKAEYYRLFAINPKLLKYKNGWLNKRIGNVPRQHCEVKT